MISFSESKNDVSFQYSRDQLVDDRDDESLSLYHEDKEIVQDYVTYNDELPSCALECHEVVSKFNYYYASDVIDGIQKLSGELKCDWLSFHFNHIDEDIVENIDLHFASLIGEVDNVSSCDGNSNFFFLIC